MTLSSSELPQINSLENEQESPVLSQVDVLDEIRQKAESLSAFMLNKDKLQNWELVSFPRDDWGHRVISARNVSAPAWGVENPSEGLELIVQNWGPNWNKTTYILKASPYWGATLQNWWEIDTELNQEEFMREIEKLNTMIESLSIKMQQKRVDTLKNLQVRAEEEDSDSEGSVASLLNLV